MPKIATWLTACALATALLTPPAQAQSRGANGEEELARALTGRTAGRPVNCINLRSVSATRVIRRTAIVYQVGRTLYVNRLRGGAESLNRDDILLTRTSGNQLCSIDSIRLLDRTSRTPRGFVTLDKFVPYTRARGDRR